MGKLKLSILKISKTWRLTIVGLPILVGLLTIFWKVQQDDINCLDQRIQGLRQEIVKQSKTVKPKDRLALEKDLLTIEGERIKIQNAIYAILIQTLGGMFFLVSAYFTWRGVKTAEANLRATEDKQVTERFSKAVEQLASDKLEVRLGGIYALERIAKDSERDYWIIMEVLTSFVKTNSPVVQTINTQKQLSPVTADIQAVLTVIGRRDLIQEQEERSLDLSCTNFTGADFREADLRKADFREADLREVYLGEANLSGADFRRANLSRVNPPRTNVVTRSVNFAEALLTQTNLSEARLVRADFSGAELNEANLGAAFLYETKFVKANLNEANLSGADLSRANLNEANLSGANLSRAILKGTNFSGVKGLRKEQVKSAQDWEDAKYDEDFRKVLGLP